MQAKSYTEALADALAIVREHGTGSDAEQWFAVARGCLNEYDDPIDLIAALSGLFQTMLSLVDAAEGRVPSEELLDLTYRTAVEMAIEDPEA